MKKKKKSTKLTREFWERDAEGKRKLAERIAYHERRLEEARQERERSASTGD